MQNGSEKVFRLVNPDQVGDTSFIVLCDHASNQLPKEFGSLGLSSQEFDRHIAYDLGAEPLTCILANHLKAPAFLTSFSRLLIDCNRGKDDPTLVSCLSDGTIVPGNIQLTSASLNQRIELFYNPYHQAIEAAINQTLSKNIVPALISIHTFTPQWRGKRRPWHVGILWDKDPRLAQPLMKELEKLPDFIVGNNEPYRGWLRGDTLWQHGTQRGIPHVLIEIRQDLLTNKTSVQKWGDYLSSILLSIQKNSDFKKDLCKIRIYGSRTDDGNLNF